MHQGVNVPEFSSPLPNSLGVIVTVRLKRQYAISHTARECTCAQRGSQIKDAFCTLAFPNCPNLNHPPQATAWASKMLTNYHDIKGEANEREMLTSLRLISPKIQRVVFLHCFPGWVSLSVTSFKGHASTPLSLWSKSNLRSLGANPSI